MNQKLSHEKNELEFDRRFEQLVEVVELNLSSMSVIPLTRYLWGITVVGISDSDHIKTVFEAYNQRVESYDILDVPNEDVTIQTTEELAMMLWTVGCVKETFKWTNIPLVTAILQRLTVYNYKHSTLNGLRSGLLARVLWSTAVHNVFSHDLYIHAVYSILFRHSIEELSSTSAVTLLWASHLFRTSNQKWTEKVINRIVLDIVDDNGNVALPLFPMLSDALCSIYQSSVFVDTTNLTGGNETSEHAGTTNREQHDSIQSVIEDTFTVDDIVRIRCLVERIARWMQPRVHQAMESHTVSASALATIIKLLVVTNTLHGDVYDKYLQYIGAAVEGNKSPQLRLTAAAQTLEVMARWGHKNHEHDPGNKLKVQLIYIFSTNNNRIFFQQSRIETVLETRTAVMTGARKHALPLLPIAHPQFHKPPHPPLPIMQLLIASLHGTGPQFWLPGKCEGGPGPWHRIEYLPLPGMCSALVGCKGAHSGGDLLNAFTAMLSFVCNIYFVLENFH